MTETPGRPWWLTRAKDYEDIGHGVSILVTRWYKDPDDEYPCGLLVKHPKPDGSGMCEASMTFDTPRNREKRGGSADHSRINPPPETAFWTVVAEDPLTLSPSLLCTECGHHGHITEGRWQPA